MIVRLKGSALIAVSQEQLAKLNGILQLLDECPPGQERENRRAVPRMALRMPLTAMLLSAIAPTPVPIYLRNISVSGMGFVSRRLFRRNEYIAAALRSPGITGKLILARISFGRYVRGGHHDMGAEFLECVADPRGEAPIPDHWLSGITHARCESPAPLAPR